MASSLPLVSVRCTLRLNVETQKKLIPSSPDKSQRLLSPRRQTGIQVDGPLESKGLLDFREALSMIQDSTEVESSCYVPLLQECIDQVSLSSTEAVHAHIIKSGTHQDLFISTFLVNVYGKCGSMENARRVFDCMPRRNVVAWTTLITGYVQNSEPEIALSVFQDMLVGGSYPTNFTLGAVLSASSLLSSLELGKQIHGFVIKYRIEDDSSVGNSLCSLYSSYGHLDSAVLTFQKIREKNVVSWTAMISACGENGKSLKGLRIFLEMLSEGVAPNEYTLTAVLSLCCTMSYLGVGSQLHSLSVKLGFDSNLRIRNSLMYLYLKCGCMEEAEKLFDGIISATLVTWNALIAGHARIMETTSDDLCAQKSGTEALKIFLKLNRSGLKPDLYTFSSALTVCSRLMGLEQGEQIHAQALKAGFLSEVVVGTALMNMYNRCGSIEDASKAFVEMSARTLISWTSMITGLASHGQSDRALQLFDDMREAGIRPNEITFTGVLSACRHARTVEEALEYLRMMQNTYEIKPLMEHYGCIVEMFVRSGQVDEAFEFIKTMNLQPNEYIWSVVLAGCRANGNSRLGFHAAEQLLKLKPKDPETYELLLKTYISAGKLEEVSKLTELIKDENVGKKKEDWSWITIKDKVHSFRPDDRTHPRYEEIHKLLEKLLEKAKAHGYEPKQVNAESVEAEDERNSFPFGAHHGEILALGLGLLSTPDPAVIRIAKSASMSSESHSFMKIASVLTGRTVVIRDGKRLHRFVDGNCSCRETYRLHLYSDFKPHGIR